jgi:hypothetical protein
MHSTTKEQAQNMKLRLCSYVAVASLLLYAQQTALLHSFAHIPSNMPPPERQLPHSKVCDKCLAYAGVSGVLPSDNPIILLKHASPDSFIGAAQLFTSLFFFAFSSRAPPVFL